jgi:fatty-acyl-CoA synthase
MSMLTGAKHVLTETFDAAECIRLIEAEHATLINGFETHVKDLTEAQERLRLDVSSLRTGLIAAGMHSATPILHRAAEVLPTLRSVSGYGMSEMGAGTLVGALDDDLAHRAETSGYPAIGYEVRIVDPETGADQPAGVPGEILFKGYSLMMGYYNKPEETAASFDDGGWFHTGDTALWLEDGYIRFLGRYKDMLKVGGENVDPMEVEGLLLQLPEVHQVAVVSLPDPRLTEVPLAFVQRVPEATIGEDEIIGFCRGKVASFKIPRHVVFVDDFPMTASGKIRKIELRETARGLGLGETRAQGQPAEA